MHLRKYFSRRSDLAARSLKENMSKYKLIQTTLDGDHARRTNLSQFLLILCFSTLANYWKHFLTSQNNFTSSSTIRKCRQLVYAVYTEQLHLVIVSMSFLHATFMKLGENDSAYELARMLQASSKFNFIVYFIFNGNVFSIIRISFWEGKARKAFFSCESDKAVNT